MSHRFASNLIMQIIDFSRSFLTFRIDALKKPPTTVTHKPPFSLNNARIPIECLCEVQEKSTGGTQTFVLGANCKTELVGVEADIFTQPNADFVPIFSKQQFLILKTFDRADKGVKLYPPSLGVQSERQTGQVEEVFDSLRIDLVFETGEALETKAAIVGAVLANRRLVGQTKISDGHYEATIVYPIKTINVNERDNIYQTDTGPVLLPNFALEPDEFIAGFELAFSAFNSPHWIEFIVRNKSPVAEGISVYHYCKPVRFASENKTIQLRN